MLAVGSSAIRAYARWPVASSLWKPACKVSCPYACPVWRYFILRILRRVVTRSLRLPAGPNLGAWRPAD